MENEEKIHYISQKEAHNIDTSKVAYLTLNDGTVLLINDDSSQNYSQKNIIIDDLQCEEINNSEEDKYNQNNEEEKQQNQEDENKEQINYIQNDNEELNYAFQEQSENNQETYKNKNFLCNCHINKQKINSNNGNNYFVGKRDSKNYGYKIIEAIPVKFCYIEGAHLVKQTVNDRTNFHQYNNNTYIIDRSNRDTFSYYQINTQSSSNENEENNMNIFKINKNLKCNCPIGKRHFHREEEIKNAELKCNCLKREGQMKCCCPIGNPKMK